MEKHARRRHEFRTALLRDDVARHGGVEKFRPRFHAALVGHFGEIFRAVHAERAQAIFFVAREPGAVVAADVHHEVAFLQTKPLDQPFAAVLKMFPQRLRGAGDIQILLEHRFLRHGVVDLHRRAVVAVTNLQRIIRLLVRQILRQQQAVAMRLVAEIEKHFQFLAIANAAGHKSGFNGLRRQ